MSVPIASIGEDAFDGLDLLSPASPASRSPLGDDGVGVVSARSGVDPDSASLRASVRDENAIAGASVITGDSGIASASFARVYASRVGVTPLEEFQLTTPRLRDARRGRVARRTGSRARERRDACRAVRARSTLGASRRAVNRCSRSRGYNFYASR